MLRPRRRPMHRPSALVRVLALRRGSKSGSSPGNRPSYSGVVVVFGPELLEGFRFLDLRLGGPGRGDLRPVQPVSDPGRTCGARDCAGVRRGGAGWRAGAAVRRVVQAPGWHGQVRSQPAPVKPRHSPYGPGNLAILHSYWLAHRPTAQSAPSSLIRAARGRPGRHSPGHDQTPVGPRPLWPDAGCSQPDWPDPGARRRSSRPGLLAPPDWPGAGCWPQPGQDGRRAARRRRTSRRPGLPSRQDKAEPEEHRTSQRDPAGPDGPDGGWGTWARRGAVP